MIRVSHGNSWYEVSTEQPQDIIIVLAIFKDLQRATREQLCIRIVF